jgi:hypothetical protein
MKRTLVFDIEIYRNYFLIVFIDVMTGDVFAWEMAAGEKLDTKGLRRFVRRHRLIGFNSRNFDMPVLFAALAGFTTSEIKDVADDIIVGQMKPWDIEREWKFKIDRDIDSVDLIEVAPGQASLKIYNGRMHGKRMQDLPIEPSAILTPAEMDIVFDYCCNDLAATKLMLTKLGEGLKLRETMSKEYGLDLRSKSDAQVAEAVIKSEVAAILGYEPKKPDTAAASFKYDIPDYITFYDDRLLDLLDAIESTTFRVNGKGKVILPGAMTEKLIRIGKSAYRMGIGGLHSTESTVKHLADDEYMLVDRDVASYYPRIIINHDLHPKQMGFAFQRVYQRIVNRRLAAKAEAGRLKKEIADLKEAMKGANSNGGPSLMEERLAELTEALLTATTAQDSLKITINGSFGKFGNRWSSLYSPKLLIQTTLTGQLSLLMLIERLERAGFRVVSANTDGIVIKVRRADKARMDAIVARWERDTKFETEETEYKALYSRDVNNYIAIKPNGEAKLKGAYAPPGWQKNPTNQICVEAVIEFLTKGAPINKTIRACSDITKFVTVRAVKGGGMWGKEYLGKAIRWYYAADLDTTINYKNANKSGNHNKVPKSEGARPIMNLPDLFPTDINYGWYATEARSILTDIGYLDYLTAPPKKKKDHVPVDDEPQYDAEPGTYDFVGD